MKIYKNKRHLIKYLNSKSCEPYFSVKNLGVSCETLLTPKWVFTHIFNTTLF